MSLIPIVFLGYTYVHIISLGFEIFFIIRFFKIQIISEGYSCYSFSVVVTGPVWAVDET